MRVGALLVRNEADSWLSKVLAQLTRICDAVVVLDDVSTDSTPDICRAAGAEVHRERVSRFETDELTLRRRLWGLAAKRAKVGGWVLCLDADETFGDDMGPAVWDHAQEIAKDLQANGLAFRLYDMWSPTHYREDEHWNAHWRWWTLCVRVEKGPYLWREQPVHCGRFPVNAGTKALCLPWRVQHWGWSRPEDRKRKYERYRRHDPDGRYGVPAQYASILDSEPALRRWV